MHFTTATGAAVLLALAPSTLALGKAKVINNCGANAWFASVAQNIHADMAELPTDGYEESYSLPDVGVSIKLAPSSSSPVTQMEFTWSETTKSIFYDISNIDGFPFVEGGMSLVPSEAGCDGFPTCQAVICHAGEERCDSAYNNPDDVRTMVCPDTSDLVMTLCPENGNGTSTTSSPPSETSSSTPSQWTQWWGGSKRAAEPHSHGHRAHARHLK